MGGGFGGLGVGFRVWGLGFGVDLLRLAALEGVPERALPLRVGVGVEG